MAGLWAGSALQAVTMSERVGDASALKMAFAAWSKGSQALILTARAAAEAAGVGQWLLAEWAHSSPALPSMLERSARAATTKGWRWTGEMEEVAAFLNFLGLPDGSPRAAAELFARVPRSEPGDGPPDMAHLWGDVPRAPRTP